MSRLNDSAVTFTYYRMLETQPDEIAVLVHTLAVCEIVWRKVEVEIRWVSED